MDLHGPERRQLPVTGARTQEAGVQRCCELQTAEPVDAPHRRFPAAGRRGPAPLPISKQLSSLSTATATPAGRSVSPFWLTRPTAGLRLSLLSRRPVLDN